MAWKIERWLSEVFPGSDKLYSHYNSLTPRELAIVAAAVIDAALVELLFIRLSRNEKEAEEFLGVNGDGRAPCGSFGARIQLAIMTGIITERDAAVFRKIKALRNLFAHKVNVSFTSPEVIRLCCELCDIWLNYVDYIQDFMKKKNRPAIPDLDKLRILRQAIPLHPEAAMALVLTLLMFFQAYLHGHHTSIKRIELIE